MAANTGTGGGSRANGTELGVGYISIHADTSRVASEIGPVVTESGRRAGTSAGEAAGGEFSKKLKDGAEKGAVAAGAAAGAGILAGLHQAQSMQDLEGSVMAQIGGTPEEAKVVAEAAGAAYVSGWGESVEEMGQLSANLSQIMADVGDEGDLEGLTVKMQAMAQTFGQDTDKIANSAGNLVKTGLAGSVTEAVDLMSAGFQSSGKLAEDFLDSIDEYGVQFQSIGISGADAIGLMNQSLAAGARNGDLVADALKEWSIRSVDLGDKAVVQAFEDLGFSADEMAAKVAEGGPAAKEAMQQVLDALRETDDPLVRGSAATGLFATKWEDLKSSLLVMDPSTATAALGEVGGAADQMTQDAKGFDQSWAEITRTLNESLGAALGPVLPYLKKLADVGLVFFKWLGENPLITGIILAIGAALGIAAAGMWLWNAAMLGNPATWILMLIIVVIALVVAAVWTLFQHWDSVMKALGLAGDFFAQHFAAICSSIGDFFAAAGEWVKQKWSEVCGAVSGFFAGVANWITDKWDATMHLIHVGAVNMQGGLVSVWNGIKHGVNGVIHAVNGIARAIEYVLTLGGKLGSLGWGEYDTLDMTEMPGLATGGTITGSGTVMVGERGPELLKLPRAASVIPLDHPAANVGTGSGSSKTVNITVNNPVAEKTSITTRKASQLIGASLGV